MQHEGRPCVKQDPAECHMVGAQITVPAQRQWMLHSLM